MEHRNLGFECRVCEWYWLDFLHDLKYAVGEQFRIRSSSRAAAGSMEWARPIVYPEGLAISHPQNRNFAAFRDHRRSAALSTNLHSEHNSATMKYIHSEETLTIPEGGKITMLNYSFAITANYLSNSSEGPHQDEDSHSRGPPR